MVRPEAPRGCLYEFGVFQKGFRALSQRSLGLIYGRFPADPYKKVLAAPTSWGSFTWAP